MNLNKILFFILILILSSVGVYSYNAGNDHIYSISATSDVDDDVIIHTVAKGETVYSIASKYNVSVQDIYRLNPGSEKGIKEGSKLKIPQTKKVSGYSNHLIEPKETLYSVARMYKMSVDDIKKANPGLDETSFSSGKTIKIPTIGNSPFVLTTYNHSSVTAPEPDYRVKKGETLYSIGKAHNVSVERLLAANPNLKEGGLREGMNIVIPRVGTSPDPERNITYGNENTAKPQLYASKGETVRIGILFPFTDSKGSVQKDKLAEYYQGFLIALKEMKEKGLNAEIYTFDTGTEKNTKRLESLLGTNEMKNLHLIIGGVSEAQVNTLSKFSKETGIKYVLPFGATNSISANSNIFQMTTSTSSLYTDIAFAFIKRFSNDNIIFVSEKGSDNNKSDFVNELKKNLTNSGITFKSIANSENLLNSIKGQLSSTQRNVILPTSSSEGSLRRITGTIATLPTSGSLTLFGYPEWQTYRHQQANLHKFDAYIYSTFFLDEQQKKVQDFAEQYRYWYNKPIINSFPRWAFLGYDTGLFFLTALKDYGSGFEKNINRIYAPTLQSSVYLLPVNESGGGYINKGLYFIHYKSESGIEKLDINDRW